MAKYRCLSDEILYNDNFLSLPASARDLYNYINQKTDDYGFCCEAQNIMRTLRAKPKDLQMLIDKNYLIKFEDWLYLEKHFFINNRNLRRDRIKPSNYMEYLDRVIVKNNGAYSLVIKCQPNDTKPQPIDDKMAPNTIQYNLIQSNTIQDKVIESASDLKAALRGQL